VNLAVVARMFCLPPKRLYHWYKHFLSDYLSDKEQGVWCSQTIESVDKDTGEITEKPLYVFSPDSIGEKMCIDDKELGHEGYTILSNAETGKMALMVESCRADEVEQAMSKFGSHLHKIKSVSMDMSATYALVINNLIPRTVRVIDKFHVMKYVYSVVNDIRSKTVKELQKQLSKGRKRSENDKKLLSKIELLRRVSRALVKSPDKWSVEMKKTVYQAFEMFKEIETAYQISQKFKQWYSYENRIFSTETIVHKLHQWYSEASIVTEFGGVVKMIRKHETQIINFFKNGLTNAKAERLNGKIERFASGNYGIKDKDFFLWRVGGYFS